MVVFQLRCNCAREIGVLLPCSLCPRQLHAAEYLPSQLSSHTQLAHFPSSAPPSPNLPLIMCVPVSTRHLDMRPSNASVICCIIAGWVTGSAAQSISWPKGLWWPPLWWPPRAFNCYTKEVWSAEKTKWCCKMQINCPFDCFSKEVWPAEKSKWCCEKMQINCQITEPCFHWGRRLSNGQLDDTIPGYPFIPGKHCSPPPPPPSPAPPPPPPSPNPPPGEDDDDGPDDPGTGF